MKTNVVSDDKIYELVEKLCDNKITKRQFFYWITTWNVDYKRIKWIVFKREAIKTLRTFAICLAFLIPIAIWAYLTNPNFLK
jgi:hypothetical protein